MNVGEQDQMAAAARNFAILYGTLFKQLMAEGLTRKQAFELVCILAAKTP
jgi:hypothetical protein